MRQRMIGRIVGLSVIILLLYTYNSELDARRQGRMRGIIQRRCEEAGDMRQRMIGRIVGLSVIILLLYTYNSELDARRQG